MKKIFAAFVRWFDSDYNADVAENDTRIPVKTVDWVRCIPFVFLHVACLGAFIWGVSPIAVGVAALSYAVRMFAITGVYHRYFSHKTYKTSRFFQFLLAVLGGTAVQRGALWWAAHHRHHHMYSDQPEDVHSPRQHGFWWSHMGWITSKSSFATRYRFIPDLAKFPELVFLNRFDTLVPILYAASLFFLGRILGREFPELRTSGMQMLTWGFFISTTVLFHATQTINSLSHLFGRQRYKDTGDDSRNNFWLAMLTFGEGWHNNHHYFQAATRQGFFWWEIDLTYYVLKMLAWSGLIWNLQPVPQHVLDNKRPNPGAPPSPTRTPVTA